jgi:glycine/D-amino acid oxidase-like deaminating enzyme
MDRLEYRGGWAGLYDMSEDGSAIPGLVPGLENVYEAHSFSGRGVMQSWAAGRALAELMLTGGFRTIDASALSAERFALGHHLTEPLHI